MASSTISGPGSGYDTKPSFRRLSALKRRPSRPKSLRSKDTTVKLSAVGTVKTALEAFQAAITKLNNVSAFNGLAASTSEEKKR